MKKQEAEAAVAALIKPIFGFSLKRCRSIQDAEDLSQEIALKSYRALILRDDVTDVHRFVWTIAHNMLSNYYRDSARYRLGVPVEEAEDLPAEEDAEDERLCCLRGEIARLSRLQRRIVIACYFENRRQADIARELGIPLGTVKWHLFEARKELKRGLDTMRKASDLTFNPITFHSHAVNGSIGDRHPKEYFRSALPQNICYCVRRSAMTVNDIAEQLGVSPVFVENEADILEENGFLRLENGRYMANFIIDEPDREYLLMRDALYRRAADLFANELFDAVTASGLPDLPDIRCGQNDRNYLLWSLIPYAAARSGDAPGKISFEEAVTIRPDGGRYIYRAAVLPAHLDLPEDYIDVPDWSGPMWNTMTPDTMWQLDTVWSDRPNGNERNVAEDHLTALMLYGMEKEGALSRLDYAWLAQHGYVSISGDPEGLFTAEWQIVILPEEIEQRLRGIGDAVRARVTDSMAEMAAPYIRARLEMVPAHLRRVEEFELQQLFRGDGVFLVHCLAALLRSGRLQLPQQRQRRTLSTVLVAG